LHRAGASDGLCHRGDPDDSIGGHRSARREIARAEPALEKWTVCRGSSGDDTWNFPDLGGTPKHCGYCIGVGHSSPPLRDYLLDQEGW
jgi:hypothetical protein